MKNILFISGTRADYGKIKTLILKTQQSSLFKSHVFVTGMHMLEKYGATYKEFEKDNIENITSYINQTGETEMTVSLSNTILGLNTFLSSNKIDLIVVHGDRLEALAGSIVGAFRNIRVAHIEGGEVSGTIDESIRHAITKFAHIHLVCNDEAKKRIVQLGENVKSIFVMGSPDIDIMIKDDLPKIEEVKSHYQIGYDKYGIFMYHPVTTEVDSLKEKIKETVDALIASGKNYVCIFPNNDEGSNFIFEELNRLKDNPKFRLFPSLRFESFLTLLKESDFIIGNSSAGVREAGVYGVPCVDIGVRQNGRYKKGISKNIIHSSENNQEILKAISRIDEYRNYEEHIFGSGNSNDRFMNILNGEEIWNLEYQKIFNDLDY